MAKQYMAFDSAVTTMTASAATAKLRWRPGCRRAGVGWPRRPRQQEVEDHSPPPAAGNSQRRRAMKYSGAMMTLACLVALVLLSGEQQVQAMPPAQCSPGLLDEVPPRIRKVCAALSTIYELGSAMENYINDKVPVLREGIPLPDSGVKRQDVDHVFLRFGRRR